MKKLFSLLLILVSFSVAGQHSKFIGTFRQSNDTIIILSDTTFRISIQGFDSSFYLRREIFTGKGKIKGNHFTIVRFDPSQQVIPFWTCTEIELRFNRLHAPQCNLTSTRKSYKRVRKTGR